MMITDTNISLDSLHENLHRLSLQDVESIVDQFYLMPNASNQAAYETLLASDEAWNLYTEMLSPTSSMRVQFFGANILYMRITRDLHKITSNELYILQSNLANFISTFAKSGPQVVFIRLCVCLIQLILRLMPNQWANPFEDLISLFSRILPHDYSRYAILTLFKIFPEEYDTLQDAEIRQTVGSQISNLAAFVFAYIEHDRCQDALDMKCLSSWAKLGVDVLLFTPVLLDLIFRSLCKKDNDGESESACETLTELFSSQNAINFKFFWVNRILPRLIDLKYHFSITYGSKNQKMIHMTQLCKVLTNFAENHAHVLFYEECRELLFPFMSLLLACTSFPGQYPNEETISEQTLSSWYAIQDELLHTKVSSSECLEQMKNFYRSLVRCLIEKCCLPLVELSADDAETFRCYRINCSDTINYVYNVLQTETFDILLQSLKEKTNDWRRQESALFLLGSLAEQEDIERKSMHEIFEVLPSIPFDGNNKLILTGLLFVGQLAESLKFFPEYIYFAVDFCIRCLKNPYFLTYASLSLKSITRESREFVVKYTEFIVANCFEIVINEQYPMNERLKCMCAIGYTLSFVHPQDLTISYFDKVVRPYVHQILKVLSESPDNGESKQLVMNNLLFISNFINSFISPIYEESQHLVTILNDSCLLLLEGLIPVFLSILPLRSSNLCLSAVECIFDIMSHFISFLQAEFVDFLPDLRNMIDFVRPCWIHKHMLNVVRQCCMIFDVRDVHFKHNQTVKYLLVNACQRFLCSVNGAGAGAGGGGGGGAGAAETLNDVDVDLIEEFLLFCHQLLRQKMYLFDILNDEIVQMILRTCINALQLQEVVLIRAAASCLVGFISYGRLKPVFLTEGRELTRIIVCSVGMHTPRFSVELLVTPLTAMSIHFPDMFRMWLRNALDCDELRHVPPVAKEKFLTVFTSEKNKTHLRQAVSSFALVCRGLSGTDYAKQTSRYF